MSSWGSVFSDEDAMGWSAYLKPAFTNKVTFATTNASLGINYVNDKLCETLGYSRQQILGNRLPIGATEDTHGMFLEEIEEAVSVFGKWKGTLSHTDVSGETS